MCSSDLASDCRQPGHCAAAGICLLVAHHSRGNDLVRVRCHAAIGLLRVAHHAAQAAAQVFQHGLQYRKAGMGLIDVRTRKYEQHDLFAAEQSEKSQRLMKVLDRVNQRYGKHTLTLANEGVQQSWAMSRNYLSPRYTTRWGELPVIKC